MNEFEVTAARFVEESREAQASGTALVQLPLWDDDQRAAPAAVLRSALFGVIKRGNRKAVENETLAAWADNKIRYTGFKLDQSDLDCWLHVLHLARHFPLGRDVRFAARAFLRAIGRSGGGKDQEWLKRSLNRMVACAVAICVGGQEYHGSLISDFFVDEQSGRYVVRINPLLAALFDEAFVKLSMEKRLALPQGLARYLQGYVQSHKATVCSPHRIGLARLQELCGSTNNHRDFRHKLKKAMQVLEDNGIVSSWLLTDGGALEFVRPCAG